MVDDSRVKPRVDGRHSALRKHEQQHRPTPGQLRVQPPHRVLGTTEVSSEFSHPTGSWAQQAHRSAQSSATPPGPGHNRHRGQLRVQPPHRVLGTTEVSSEFSHPTGSWAQQRSAQSSATPPGPGHSRGQLRVQPPHPGPGHNRHIGQLRVQPPHRVLGTAGRGHWISRVTGRGGAQKGGPNRG